MEEKTKITVKTEKKQPTKFVVAKKADGKKTPKKSQSNKQPTKKQADSTANVVKEKKEIDFAAATKPKFKKIDLSEDFNESTFFDVALYRELFMELRKQMDELSAKRNKSEKSYAEYDDAVYNITSNAVSDPGAQDFLGFCYKKGFYDFCVMNYEKYMKWTILAAANGNAFSLSKLQVFLTISLDKIMEIDNQSLLVDFLDISGENYMLLLSKMICEAIVKILNISSEELIKLPEKYAEATEELQKEFDNAKMEATEIVYKEIKNAVEQLKIALEEKIKAENESKLANAKKEETFKADSVLASKENLDNEKEQEEPSETENKFKRNLKIRKKFRY